MPATEEFPVGPAGRQTPAPVLQMEGKRPTRLDVQKWGTTFRTEGYAGAKAGEYTARGEKNKKAVCSYGRASRRQDIGWQGTAACRRSASAQPSGGITLGCEHPDGRARSRLRVCPEPSTPQWALGEPAPRVGQQHVG